MISGLLQSASEEEGGNCCCAGGQIEWACFTGSVSRRCRLHFAVGSGTTSLKGGTAHYKFDAKIRVMPRPPQ